MKKLLFLFLGLLYACRQPDKPIKPNDSFSDIDLPKYGKEQLLADFDLLVNSLKEAHTGLYWYTTRQTFDSFATIQRAKISDSLNGLQFYHIVAPVVALTREDHCDISVSKAIKEYLHDKGRFLPLSVIHLNGKVFLLNDPVPGKIIKGKELIAVNGMDIDSIQRRIYQTFAADGFILSSKIRYLDLHRFSIEYAKVIGQRKTNTITVADPATGKAQVIETTSVDINGLKTIAAKVSTDNKIRKTEVPASLSFPGNSTAVLTFNTFGNSDFKEQHMDFKPFVDSAFSAIRAQKVQHLIIDLREDGGGSEGNEDYLFAYLTSKPYTKYKYVAVSGLTFSFLKYTDYADPKERAALERDLQREHYKAADGRYLRRPGIDRPAALKPHPFSGDVYVLISGWTYSGGAEFASLMREHTNAIFIGEETGGGFYGNTSGYHITLTLPHTGLSIEIPILKFALDVRKGPFGRGVIPDYPLQPSFDEFINGYDAELEYAKRLIRR